MENLIEARVYVWSIGALAFLGLFPVANWIEIRARQLPKIVSIIIEVAMVGVGIYYLILIPRVMMAAYSVIIHWEPYFK